MLKEFKSLTELMQVLPTEDSCMEYLEWIVWKGNVVSPYDRSSKVYKCAGYNYKCKNTGKYFNARTNTMFYRSSVPLQKWFLAIWLFMTNKKSISSIQLSKHIGVTQKTAWAMLHRMRKCFGEQNSRIELSGTVEIDETFVGGKNKNRHKDKKVAKCQGRSFKDKTPVFGMVQRGGNVVARVVADTSATTLQQEIRKTVRKGSTVYSDEWSYGKLDEMYTYEYVEHSKKVYGRGNVYTNTIEGFWSQLKRCIYGTYHKVSRKHLQKYVDEVVYRFNRRKLSLQELFDTALSCLNFRITYKDLIYANEKV
ncbi:MAG: IS1595 family transposase [Odoribacter sp.]|nr:IS1595 family transposase [Odoribacter sp.]